MTSGPADSGTQRGPRLRTWGDRRLAQWAGGRPGSLVLGCVLRYLECTENSAEALVLGTFLSIVPALLAVYALSDLSYGSGNGVAQHLIYRLHIHQPPPASCRRRSAARPVTPPRPPCSAWPAS